MDPFGNPHPQPENGYNPNQGDAQAYGGYQHPQPHHAPAHPQHHYAPPYTPDVPSVPVPPSFPAQPDTGLPADTVRPTPVVKVLSPVGVEYVFLTFTLLVGASALVGALLTLVNGDFSFASFAFPVATLLVTLPTFAGIFLHLKRLELQNPQLRLDPSKRRSTQATQIITFIVSLFTLIGFFTAVFAAISGTGVSVGKAALDALCILVVSGGILFYYWRDEHATRL